MGGRIVVDDARMDAAAAKISSVQAGLQGLQGRMNASLSAGAPPAVKGQVDAAVADARAMVAGVAGRCSARSTELRRRAIFARIASGDIRSIDLRQLAAWNAEKQFIKARMGNGKADDGGLDLGDIGDKLGDIGSDTLGFLGRNAAEIGHSTLDLAGLIPLLGEPADGINGLIYTAEGDEVNAALSYAGMIPLLGWGATAGKVGNKIRKATDAGRSKVPAPPWTRRVDGYHHTSTPEVAKLIEKTGLRPGSYVTNKIYSPKDATIRLALPQGNANPAAVLHVDLAAMRRDGIDVPKFTRVKQDYDQPGGGLEIKFEHAIDAKYITVAPRKP